MTVAIPGCGGGGSETQQTVTLQPLTLVMRPSEVELVQLQGNAASGMPSALRPTFRDVDWVGPSSGLLPCAVPADNCALNRVTAGSEDGDRRTELLNTSDGSSYLPANGFPSQPLVAPPAIRFSAGGNVTGGVSIALDANGQAWVWGSTDAGAFGPRQEGFRSQPHRLVFEGGPGPLAAVDAGMGTTGSPIVAVDRSGAVWAWARTALLNPDALGAILIPDAPVRVDGVTNAIAVAAGSRHALVLRNDGTVWAWGNNLSGQLGVPHAGDRLQADVRGPLQVPGLIDVVAIAAGAGHSLALRRDGSVWAWGDNSVGQVGGPETYQVFSPSRVTGLGTTTAISAGFNFSLALRSDGTVWAWGDNRNNQLGADSGANCRVNDPCSDQPLPAAGLTDVDTIDAGGGFALARKRDGTVWAWGDNAYGQLGGLPGLGTRVAVQVPNLPPVSSITAGFRHALAMPSAEACDVGDDRTGGRLMAWGNNLTGERGDGTALNQARATPVLTLGDSELCRGVIGRRLMVYFSGTGTGSVTSSEPGLRCLTALCWQTVSPGTTVTLTATPDAGSRAEPWRWDCATGNPPAATPIARIGALSATITLNAAKHCKAHFTRTGASNTPPPQPPPIGLAPPVISLQPADQTVTAQATATFTVTATNVPPPAVLWQRGTHSGGTWTNIAGASGASYTTPSTSVPADNGSLFRAVLTNAQGSVTSNAAVLTVLAPAGSTAPMVTQQPVNVSVVAPLIATFDAQSSGTPAPSVQWERSRVIGGARQPFEAVAGATGARYSTPPTELGVNGDRYRARFTNVAGEVATLPATLFVTTGSATGPYQLFLSLTGSGAANARVSSSIGQPGIDCQSGGSACTGSFDKDTVVTLEAHESAFARFVQWSGCVTTFANPGGPILCVVDMDSGHAVSAEFENPTAGTERATLSLLAGDATQMGSVDGQGATARFQRLTGIAARQQGIVYVSDIGNATIRAITATGLVSTVAGGVGVAGNVDGSGTMARFSGPSGLDFEPTGNMAYIADAGFNYSVRSLDVEGSVGTYAGTPSGALGCPDASARDAVAFNVPYDIAADAAGNVYVSSSSSLQGGAHSICKISIAGPVGTLAGVATISGSADGAGAAARFLEPRGLAVDAAGNVYVADSGNYTVRKISPAGVVTTLAGTAGLQGQVDGLGSAARFSSPTGLAVDAAGNVYVVDFGRTIRKITPAGNVTTVAGSPGIATLRLGANGTFEGAADVAVVGANRLAIMLQRAVLIADLP